MNNKLTIVIVCYNSVKYTKECIFSVLSNTRTFDDLLIIDNGSEDGTREFVCDLCKLHNNISYYFPSKNLYVTGAWKFVANNIKLNDYVLLLDNDASFSKNSDSWFEKCIKIFSRHSNLASIGLYNTPIQGTYAKGIVDNNYYNNKCTLNNLNYIFTDKYAGFRIDKSSIFIDNFTQWEHKFIEERYNQKLIQKGFRTARLIPGIIDDLSENNFDDPDHILYYEKFWGNYKNNIRMYNQLRCSSNGKK